MADSFTAELKDIIDRAFIGEHGGRATVEMVHHSVQANLPPHLADYLIGKGLRSQVGAYFRAKDDEGLPRRPEVNDEGEHTQLEFANVIEHEYVYAAYLARVEANAAQAEKVRQRCLDVHGVDLAGARVA